MRKKDRKMKRMFFSTHRCSVPQIQNMAGDSCKNPLGDCANISPLPQWSKHPDEEAGTLASHHKDSARSRPRHTLGTGTHCSPVLRATTEPNPSSRARVSRHLGDSFEDMMSHRHVIEGSGALFDRHGSRTRGLVVGPNSKKNTMPEPYGHHIEVVQGQAGGRNNPVSNSTTRTDRGDGVGGGTPAGGGCCCCWRSSWRVRTCCCPWAGASVTATAVGYPLVHP